MREIKNLLVEQEKLSSEINKMLCNFCQKKVSALNNYHVIYSKEFVDLQKELQAIDLAIEEYKKTTFP